MSKPLLSFLLLALLCPAEAALALPVSYYSNHSRLSSGHWVRIETDTAGIYQITPEQLAQWGFGDSRDVRVYGTSAVDAAQNTFGTYPDDLVQVPSAVTADGRIVFYGEGDVRGHLTAPETAVFTRNYYDTKSVYFLGATGEELSMTPQPYRESDDCTDIHYCLRHIEREVQNPGRGGVVFHGRRLKAGDRESFTFDMSGYSEGSTAIFRYTAAANSEQSVRFVGSLSDDAVQLRNNSVQSAANTTATRIYSALSGNISFRIKDGAGQVTATVEVPVAFKGDYAAIDNAYVIYQRDNSLAETGSLIFNLAGSLATKNFTVRGADEIMAWNVTEPLNIRNMELHRNGDGSFTGTPDSGDKRIIVFSPSATHREVRFAGFVAKTDLHSLGTPEMIVVSTATLTGCASEYASIHRELQGMDVAVVCQDDIFNEFSSGVRTPAAVRRFVKMLSDRDPGRLRYLTLYGFGTYDNRFLASERTDALVCYECENTELARDHSTNYVSDQYFGMLSDSYKPEKIINSRLDISVGRIPATDVSLARIANEKSRMRLLHVPSAAAYLRVLKFSDDGDYSLHFDHTEEFAETLAEGNRAITIARADNLLYPWKNNKGEEAARKISNSLVRGQGLFHYAGHGTPHDVTGEAIYSNHTVSTLTYGYEPLALFASCDIFPLDRDYGSMGEKMIFTLHGGAMGVITSSRKVYIDPNRVISNAVAECYASASPGDTGADIMRKARNLLVSRGMSSSLGYNTLCYNYCGDPALPLGVPEYTIDVTFPGESITDGVVALEPLRRIKVEGAVRTASGEVVSSFNGPALIEVFDYADSLSTIVRNSDDGVSQRVLCNDYLLAEYGAVVKSGRFSSEIILPEPTSGEGTKRIVVTATDATARKCAAAPLLRSTIAEAAGGDADTDAEAPEILAFDVDPDDYISPEAVGPDFTARAVISQPAAGIATGNSGIHRALTVTVDGKETRPELRGALRFGSDGNATLGIPMKNMSQGRHEIRVDVCSNTGAGSSATLAVLVGTEGVGGVLEAIGADPAGDEVEFRLQSVCTEGTLIVTDHLGNTVYRREGCAFPYLWNVCGNDGRRLFPGCYSAWVLLDNGLSHGSTPKTEIVVLR